MPNTNISCWSVADNKEMMMMVRDTTVNNSRYWNAASWPPRICNLLLFEVEKWKSFYPLVVKTSISSWGDQSKTMIICATTPGRVPLDRLSLFIALVTATTIETRGVVSEKKFQSCSWVCEIEHLARQNPSQRSNSRGIRVLAQQSHSASTQDRKSLTNKRREREKRERQS